MMLNNNQRATKSEGEKKELDFDSVLEQLLSMSKDSPSRNDPRLLKTFAPKSKDKGKSSSNETCSYCSKPGHNKRNCYYKYPNKGGDTFRERNKDKIAELRHTAGHKMPGIDQVLSAYETPEDSLHKTQRIPQAQRKMTDGILTTPHLFI